MIERLFPNVPKLEMFARAARPGWSVWGNEVPAMQPPTSDDSGREAALKATIGKGLSGPGFLKRTTGAAS